MAVDEALFHSAVNRLAPPTVRFYAWSRPTVSIGFRQELGKTCDPRACRDNGIDIVRRFTGGRAVLHHRELTYCVASATEGPFRGLSVRQVYEWVGGVLRHALHGSGIRVDSIPPASSPEAPAPASREAELPCFAASTRHEITAGGRKLAGGAQRWSRRGFAQHGSILMERDRDLWSAVWGAKASLAIAQSVGLSELSPTRLTRSRWTERLASEFQRTFGEPASEDPLSPGERSLATQLARDKYASTEWNQGLRRSPFAKRRGREHFSAERIL